MQVRLSLNCFNRQAATGGKLIVFFSLRGGLVLVFFFFLKFEYHWKSLRLWGRWFRLCTLGVCSISKRAVRIYFAEGLETNGSHAFQYAEVPAVGFLVYLFIYFFIFLRFHDRSIMTPAERISGLSGVTNTLPSQTTRTHFNGRDFGINKRTYFCTFQGQTN